LSVTFLRFFAFPKIAANMDPNIITAGTNWKVIMRAPNPIKIHPMRPIPPRIGLNSGKGDFQWAT